MRGQVQVVAAEDDVRVAVHVELHKGRILAEAAVHQQRRRGAPCLTHRAFRLSRGGRLGQRGGLSGTAAALPARVLRAQCACGARALIGRAYEARARRRSNDPVEFGGLYRECERLCLETLVRDEGYGAYSRPACSYSRPACSYSRPACSYSRPACSCSRPACSYSRPAPRECERPCLETVAKPWHGAPRRQCCCRCRAHGHGQYQPDMPH